MKKIKYIAIDLDGTLLRDDHTLSPYTKKILQTMENKGYEIFLATGRGLCGMQRYHEFADLKSPIICCNGAIVCERDGGLIVEYLLDEDISHFLIEQARKEDLYLFIYIDNRWYYEKDKDAMIAYTERVTAPGIKANFDKLPSYRFQKALFWGSEGNKDDKKALLQVEDRVEKKFGPRVYKAPSGFGLLEIINGATSKAVALEYLLKERDASFDQLLAFGDGMNDKEMLEEAGVGVKMINGNPALKTVTQYETRLSNNEDGVASFLEEYFLT